MNRSISKCFKLLKVILNLLFSLQKKKKYHHFLCIQVIHIYVYNQIILSYPFILSRSLKKNNARLSLGFQSIFLQYLRQYLHDYKCVHICSLNMKIDWKEIGYSQFSKVNLGQSQYFNELIPYSQTFIELFWVLNLFYCNLFLIGNAEYVNLIQAVVSLEMKIILKLI